MGDGLHHNDAAVLVTLYEDDLIAEVRSLPFLDPKYSWSRKMASAVKHRHVQTVQGHGHQGGC